jgi:hypothetical protein
MIIGLKTSFPVLNSFHYVYCLKFFGRNFSRFDALRTIWMWKFRFFVFESVLMVLKASLKYCVLNDDMYIEFKSLDVKS